MSAKEREPGGGEEPAQSEAVARMRERGKSPELAAVLAWLVPGTGHLYAGHLLKGAIALVLILGLHVTGLVLSRGDSIDLDMERGHPYAFVGQVGVGLPTGAVLLWKSGALPGVAAAEEPEYETRAYVERLPQLDLGLLFTMVAGLLNLLLIHDALQGVPGAVARRAEEERLKRRIEALRAELAEERATDDATAEGSAAEGAAAEGAAAEGAAAEGAAAEGRAADSS